MKRKTGLNKIMHKKRQGGFTLVELIVVIVIIIVLAATLIPTVLKYVNKASEASCKADAATILSQLQADMADMYAEGRGVNDGNLNDEPGGRDYMVGGAPVYAGPVAANYIMDNTAVFEQSPVESEEVVKFGYSNGKYIAIWRMEADKNGSANWTITKKK